VAAAGAAARAAETGQAGGGRRQSRPVTAATIDEYLAGRPDDQRAALELLRGQIRSAAPDAVETIAYAMPGYRLDGRYFLGFAATKRACSFYPGRAPLTELAGELGIYRTRKGTISYPADQPLPADLVARIVAVRLAEFRGS
jgi:uncharacterized protein YdhG (YjbR/CyaY superfamily)